MVASFISKCLTHNITQLFTKSTSLNSGSWNSGAESNESFCAYWARLREHYKGGQGGSSASSHHLSVSLSYFLTPCFLSPQVSLFCSESFTIIITKPILPYSLLQTWILSLGPSSPSSGWGGKWFLKIYNYLYMSINTSSVSEVYLLLKEISYQNIKLLQIQAGQQS